MPLHLSDQCKIEPVHEGGLAITFKITSPEGMFYLKFHEAEGARGGPFLKHLIPLDDPRIREHAEKRRHFVRKMLDSVLEQRATLIPRPCYFDLLPLPMAIQKLRKQNGQVVAELRVEGEGAPPRLQGMVGTLWLGLDIQHIPTLSPEKKDVWNPLDYSPENVFLCTATIDEFQAKADFFLQKKDPVKLCHKLQHEQRALMGYDRLVGEFLSSLDHASDLETFGKTILSRIEERLLQASASSITELENRFLASVSIPAEQAQLPFQKLLFIAERERLWTPAQRMEGKAIDQLRQAETMAQAMIKDPNKFLSLIEDLQKFKVTYARLEQLPLAMVPQDAHPFNFFINQADANTSMLDLEDLSMGTRLADLSTVYVFKILRGLAQKKITQELAVEYLKAVINGYNSTAPAPLSQQELQLMTDYSIGVFLNFLPQFGIIFRAF